ncbi:PREDICTED: uncharacterized protein LOC102007735 [Chinchilla lanigera]|uniref:uncharacterized protein LOC102007735 n=1 Tax=Chinchilla lanigera TaxID=34839 RepID=UPI00038E9878|nr:PREDICTED: uncharacterized protein LOC102007735 [Chinchilla lanigera]
MGDTAVDGERDSWEGRGDTVAKKSPVTPRIGNGRPPSPREGDSQARDRTLRSSHAPVCKGGEGRVCRWYWEDEMGKARSSEEGTGEMSGEPGPTRWPWGEDKPAAFSGPGVLSWSQREPRSYRARRRVREPACPNYLAEPLQSLPGEDLQLPGAREGYGGKAWCSTQGACSACHGLGNPELCRPSQWQALHVKVGDPQTRAPIQLHRPWAECRAEAWLAPATVAMSIIN